MSNSNSPSGTTHYYITCPNCGSKKAYTWKNAYYRCPDCNVFGSATIN